MRTRNLAILCRTLAAGAGGMERTAAGVANAMTARGWSVSMFYNATGGRQSVYSLDPGVARHEIPRRGGRPELYAEAIRSSEPDVCLIMASDCTAVPFVARIAELEVPIVIHEGSNPERIVGTNWSERKGLAVVEAQRERDAMAALAVKVRVTLPEYRNSFPEFLQPDVVAFPNAFRPADPGFRELRDRQTRRRFINIGGLKRVKNLNVAALAFVRMAEDFPLWDFVVYSARPASGSVLSEVSRTIADAGLSERFVIRDPVSDIYAEYAKSHVHVISSLSEGLPNCVAEAMCHALPSIGFDTCPGTNALIEHGRNGILADATAQVASLEAAMRRLAGDDELRRTLGERALIDSRAFLPESIFRKWDSLLRAVANTKRPLPFLFGQRLKKAGPEGKKYENVQVSALRYRIKGLRPRYIGAPNPLVSIIVTVFNKIEYLDNTLRSILNCSYDNLEVIVVDDCSSDGSPEAVLSFLRDRNLNWRLILHSANKGLSVSRNSGLEQSSGKYVQFWDADDVYDPHGLTKLVEQAEEDAADISTAIATRDGLVLRQYEASNTSRRCVTFSEFPDAMSAASSCFKLYRREFLDINGLRFIPGLRMQDSEFNLRAFALARVITVTPIVLGEYTLVRQSGSRDRGKDKFASTLFIADSTASFYEDHWFHSIDINRQKHILRSVFWMFVRHSLLEIYRPGRQSTESQFVGDAFDYIDEVKARLAGYSHGIRSFLISDPQCALTFSALAGGLPSLAVAFAQGLVPPNFNVSCFPQDILCTEELVQALKKLHK